MLGKCECSSKFINLVKALHDKMQVHVAQENTSSRNLQSPVDVKQGSVLAPTPFSLYRTAMLEVAFDGVGNSIYIQTNANPDLFDVALFRAKTRTTQILVREMLFAGDSGIVAHSVGDIQSLEDRIARAASQFGPRTVYPLQIPRKQSSSTLAQTVNSETRREMLVLLL